MALLLNPPHDKALEEVMRYCFDKGPTGLHGRNHVQTVTSSRFLLGPFACGRMVGTEVGVNTKCRHCHVVKGFSIRIVHANVLTLFTTVSGTVKFAHCVAILEQVICKKAAPTASVPSYSGKLAF